MINFNMSKDRKVSVLQKFFKFLIILIILTIIFLVGWRIYGIESIKQTSLNQTTNIKSNTKTIFDSYFVKTKRVDKNLYYITLYNVYSKAASIGEDPVPHYFKINIVFQTNNKDSVKNIENIINSTVGEIRLQLENYPVYNVEYVEIMGFLKRHLKRKMNKALGENAVKEVYINSFLAQ